MVYRPFTRKRNLAVGPKPFGTGSGQDKYRMEPVLRSVESGPPSQYDEATRLCGFYLLGALGPTNSGTPARSRASKYRSTSGGVLLSLR